jgi:glycosyltransferase involved in cell wall biosynthesis
LAIVTKYAKKNEHVRIISYPTNIGKGYAVRTGFMESSGDIVIFADSDMEIDLTTISKYLDALREGDIVIASKRHPDSKVEVPFSRKLMSQVFNNLVRLLTGIPLNDTQSGLKAMRKSAFIDIIPRLAIKRYAFDVELLAVANLYGLKVVEMPVMLNLDASFKMKQIGLMFIDLLGIAYRLRIIHWYQAHIPKKNSLQRLVAVIFREKQ